MQEEISELPMKRLTVQHGSSMFISIPAAVGLAVLAGPVVRILFPGTNGEGALLLVLGAVTVILNGNSNISNGVLQGIGKPRIPMIPCSNCPCC